MGKFAIGLDYGTESGRVVGGGVSLRRWCD